MDPRIADLNSVWWGVRLSELMENAGEKIASHCIGFEDIAVICGRGNNGGDGLVAARHLLDMGQKVTVYTIEGSRSRLNQDNLEKLESKNVVFITNAFDLELSGYDLIVDALVGTGIEGDIRQPLKGIIDAINSSDAHKLSVDCPSGGMVEADAVVSLDSAKVPGAIVEDIGIPSEAKSFCGPGDVAYGIPKRRPENKKGDFGRLLVIGGSRDYLGAPILSAMAAMRAGADLVTVCVPEYVADRVHFDPNLIIRAVKGKERISAKGVRQALKLRCDAVVMGNGIGLESRNAVEEVLKRCSVPLILDADALNTCNPEWLCENVMVTPHRGEFERLFKRPAKGEDCVSEMAKKYGAVVLLKGSQDIISDGNMTRRNKTGNPYMSVGGTGDVLCGIVGGLLAQKKDLMSAGCAGAFLCGLAGDIAAGSAGPSLLATDVIDCIPDAIEFCMGLGEDQ